MSESEFHYVRTTGVDGGVDAVDGRAIGVDLDTILKDGLPPFKVALEIIAALCEILDISDQDGETHGDVHPGCIFLDDTGAISIEGFGVDRAKTMAPEGEPVGTLTDLYGLGYCAYRLLATRDLTGLPSDPDDHDDAVIDAVVALPWGDMPEDWVGDIQWFLAKLMSFEPEERPTAVDAWRTFIAFAEEAEGATLVDWSPDAIEGGGTRRDAAMAVRPAADEGEDLGGPVVSSGPLAKGQISFATGGAKGGQATAFWSKEQMKAALEAEEEEDDSFKPQVGGGAATSFWTRDQMEAMARGDASAPRPKRKDGGKPRPATPAAAPPPAVAPPPPAPPPPAPPPAAPPPVAAPPPAAPPPPVAAPPPIAAAGGPIAAAPGAGGPGPAIAAPGGAPGSYDDDEDDEDGGGGMKLAVVGAIVAVFVLLCLGVGVVGGVAYFVLGNADEASTTSSSSSAASTQDKDDQQDAEEVEKQDTAVEDLTEEKPTPEVKPEPKPKPKPKPKPTTSGRRSTTTSRRSTSTNRSTTKPAPTGPTRVVFTVPGSGSVRCGDGTNKSADGRASITFKTVPSDGITCTFFDDASTPVCAGFVMPGNRKCTCNEAESEITCN